MITSPRSSRSNLKHACAALFAVLLAAAGPLSAAPLLSVFVGAPGGGVSGCPAQTATSTGAPVTVTRVCSGPTFSDSGQATASIGNLGAEASAQHFGFGSAAGIFARAFYSDTVVFSGPGAGPIEVQVNLHFSGSLITTTEAGSVVDAIVLLNSQRSAVTVSNNSGQLTCTTTFSGLGPCVNTYSTTLTSGSVSVPLDIPVSISLDLQLGAGGSGNGSSASTDFLDTFGFVTGKDLFKLPDGFTANSVTSFIVNNRFTPAGSPESEVPEPGTYALMVAGLALLAFVQRRRKKYDECRSKA